MTKKLTLLLMSLAICLPAVAQNFQFEESKSDLYNLRDRVENMVGIDQLDSRDVACGPDTSFYGWFKRPTNFVSIIFLRNDPNSLSRAAQWYDVPAGDSVTVNGFNFFANVELPGANDTITVTAALYLAGPDSLPMTLVTSTTFDVDTTGQSGLGVEFDINFPTPATVGAPYMLVIDNPDTARLSVVASSVSEQHGGGEFLGAGGTPTAWFNGYDIGFGGGLVFDADWLFSPFVEYNVSTAYEGDTCLLFDNEVTFVSTTSTIATNKFYNFLSFLDEFTGRPDSSFRWDFGDGTGFEFGDTASNTFTSAMSTYDVTLRTLILAMASGSCIDGQTKSLGAGFAARAEFTFALDMAQGVTFTDNSLASSWEWDFGDGNTSMDQNPTHQYDTGGVFIVTLVATQATSPGFCASTDTLRDTVNIFNTGIQDDLLNQQVSVYPNPSNGKYSVEIALDQAEEVTIEVHTLVGQRVAVLAPQRVLNDRLTLDLSQFQSGVYLMTLRANQRQITRKLIKN